MVQQVPLWRVDISSTFFANLRSQHDSDLHESLQPVRDYLYAYKFGREGAGNPLFTLAGKSAKTFAGQSVPTVTSLNGQIGSGIVGNFFSVDPRYKLFT
jgi:hypothetical protein